VTENRGCGTARVNPVSIFGVVLCAVLLAGIASLYKRNFNTPAKRPRTHQRRMPAQKAVGETGKLPPSYKERSGTLAGEPSVSGRDIAEQPRRESPVESDPQDDPVEGLRQSTLAGQYGTMPIEQLVRVLVDHEGPEIRDILLALGLRKDEALPVVKERLRSGEMYEKYKIGKFLAFHPWPEALPELLEIAANHGEHWLARMQALYGLAALGDPQAGPVLLSILDEADCAPVVQQLAICTAARIGSRDAVRSIRRFEKHDNVHVQLSALWALAQLGEPIDQEPILRAAHDEDYIVRQEACEILSLLDGDQITLALESLAKEDFNQSVRGAAQRGLFDRKLRKAGSFEERLAILQNALSSGHTDVSSWAVALLSKDYGPAGKELLRSVAVGNDWAAVRARELLLLETVNTKDREH